VALLTLAATFVSPVALVSADYALHVADRIEGRRTIVVRG